MLESLLFGPTFNNELSRLNTQLTDKALDVFLDMPGCDPSTITIETSDDNCIHISCERTVGESVARKIKKRISVSSDYDVSEAETSAKYVNGVLVLTIPTKKNKKKKIELLM